MDNTSKIDIQAEKLAFNDSIVQSGTYNDMAKPSEPVTKMELPQTELIGEKANIPSIEMTPVAPPSNYETDDRINMNPVVPASRESKLLNMQTSSPDNVTSKKTSNIEKQISQSILPSIQKIAQQVNDYGTKCQGNSITCMVIKKAPLRGLFSVVFHFREVLQRIFFLYIFRCNWI